MRYRVERADPEAAAPDLARIWAANLVLETDPATKHAWLYRDAPDPPTAVFLLCTDEGNGEGRPVGTAGVGIRRIWVDGRELRAGLLADLAVDKDHRSVMPALTLVREVKSWALGELDLAYGFPNQAAQGVFKRVGYKTLGSIVRYARVLRHAGYVGRAEAAELSRVPARLRGIAVRVVSRPVGARVVGALIDGVSLARGARAAIEARQALTIEWTDGADARLDELWDLAKAEHAVAAVRSARFVGWRFFRAANAAARSLALAADKRGVPRAYAVIERAGDVAHVRDLFGQRGAMIALVDLLVPALYRRGAASISFRYLGAPWFAAALEARGFAARQADRMIAIGLSDRVPPPVAAQLVDPACWHLTDADEDT